MKGRGMLKSTLPPSGELHLNALVDELGKVESSFLAPSLIMHKKKRLPSHHEAVRHQTEPNPQATQPTLGDFRAYHLSLRTQPNPPTGSSYAAWEPQIVGRFARSFGLEIEPAAAASATQQQGEAQSLYWGFWVGKVVSTAQSAQPAL
jgi:hypothetical protein